MMAREDDSSKTSSGWMGLVFGVGTLVGVLISTMVYLSGLRRRRLLVQPPASLNNSGEAKPGIAQPLDGEGPPASMESGLRSELGREMGEITAPGAGEVATHWKEETKYMVAAFMVVALALIVYASRSVFPLVILAFLIAFIVRPVIEFFRRRLKMGRIPATLITYGLVLVVILMTPFILLPNILQAINFVTTIDFQSAAHNLALVLQETSQQIASNPLVNYLFTPVLFGVSTLLENFSTTPPATQPPIAYAITFTDVTNQLAQTLGLLVNVAGPIISAVVAFIFMMMLSLYMSLSGSVLTKAYPRLIPPLYRGEISALLMRIEENWRAFLRGQLSLMVIIGVVVWMGNLILGTRQALFLGIISGLLELIPNLGPVVATIPAVAVALLFGSAWMPVGNLTFAIIVVVMYIVIQQVENQIIVPRVLGDAVELPAVVVLVGVLVFGSLFGILGIFLATPVIATGKELFGYLYGKILEPPPSPKIEQEVPGFMEKLRSALSRFKLPRLPDFSKSQNLSSSNPAVTIKPQPLNDSEPVGSESIEL